MLLEGHLFSFLLFFAGSEPVSDSSMIYLLSETGCSVLSDRFSFPFLSEFGSYEPLESRVFTVGG